MPVRPWHARASQSAASSQIQNRTVPHLPQCRVLSVRTAVSLCAQRRRSAKPQSCRSRRLRSCSRRCRATNADVAADELVYGIGSCVADRIVVAVTDHIDGQLLPRSGQSEQFLVARILVPPQSSAVASHCDQQLQLFAGGHTAAPTTAASTAATTTTATTTTTTTVGRNSSANFQSIELHHGQLQAFGDVSASLHPNCVASTFHPPYPELQ